LGGVWQAGDSTKAITQGSMKSTLTKEKRHRRQTGRKGKKERWELARDIIAEEKREKKKKRQKQNREA